MKSTTRTPVEWCGRLAGRRLPSAVAEVNVAALADHTRPRSERRATQHDGLTELRRRPEHGIDHVHDRMAVATTLVDSQPIVSRLADRARCPGALVDVVLPLGRVPCAEQLGESLDQLDLQLGLGPEPIGLSDAFGEPLGDELLREPPHVPVLEEAEVKPAAVLALVVPETRPRRRLERTRGHVVRHLQLVAEHLVRRVEQRHLDTLASPRSIAGEQRGHDGMRGDRGCVGRQQRRRR